LTIYDWVMKMKIKRYLRIDDRGKELVAVGQGFAIGYIDKGWNKCGGNTKVLKRQ
jgi:hypothetical protein